MVISILCQILPPLLWNRTASKKNKIKSIPPHKQSIPINKKLITTCLLVTLTNQKTLHRQGEQLNTANSSGTQWVIVN